jgi:hypothetical protein
MRLGQVFVLTDKDHDSIPEISRFMLSQAISNNLSLTDIGQGIATLGIDPEEKIDARTFGLFTKQQIIQFGSGSRQRLPCPI